MWAGVGSLVQPVLGASNKLLRGGQRWQPPDTVSPAPFEQPATAQAELEAAVQRLGRRAADWHSLGPAERALLIRKCVVTCKQAAEAGAQAATKAKGSYNTSYGEEFVGWVPIVWGAREYAEALEAGGQPGGSPVRETASGQLIVSVFPRGLEGLFFGGMRGELWIEPGKPASQGNVYRQEHKNKASKAPKVALVLGAGNQVSVVVLDILHMLLVVDCTVVCKINPVNAFIGPAVRAALLPLVEEGFVEIVHGGTEEGIFLSNHKAVTHIHLTGSTKTYDAVVWGKQPKAPGKLPQCSKHVTAELGCVTPFIIVPGPWTPLEIEAQADEIVSGLVHNAGHNCLKPEVLVTDASWPLRDAFVAAIRRRLDAEPQRVAWYPGSKERMADAERRIPGLKGYGQAPKPSNGHAFTPWLFSDGLSPDQADTQVENWCGVLQEVALPGTGGGAGTFMAAATEYVNERCWGSLSMSMFVHPTTQAEHKEAFEAAIAGLRYGSVQVNSCTIAGYAIPKLSWGAFPGNQSHDIMSGNCNVHNVLLYDHVQKSVLYCPFKLAPTHLWSSQHRNLVSSARGAVTFFASPGLISLTQAALQALRG